MMEYASINEAFEILGGRPIGSGGFSTVYKVRRLKDGQVYALKILNYSDKDRDKVFSDFMSEVALLERINHPTVVRVVEQFMIGGQPAILMELVEGKSLWTMIEERKYFSAEEVIELLRDLAGGLTACHDMQIPMTQRGSTTNTVLLGEFAIVHNDLHPKNIICIEASTRGRLYKLIDFGLSFANADSIRNSHRVNGMVEFKSPEKWDAKKWGDITTRSDIYSLGVVLYTMLAGHPPFGWVKDYSSGSQCYRQEQQCLSGAIPDLWEARRATIEAEEFAFPTQPDFPYWLNQLVMKCLALNPRGRFRSGRELQLYLEEGLAGKLPSDWRAHEPPPPPPPPLPDDEEAPSLSPSWWQRHRKQVQRLGLITLVTFCIVAISYLCGSLLLDWWASTRKEVVNTEQMQGRIVVERFLEADVKIMDAESIAHLEPYLSFPLNYYGDLMNSMQDFRQHYERGLKNIRAKDMKLDSIVELDTRRYVVHRTFYMQKASSVKQFNRAEYISLDSKNRIQTISYQP